MRVDTVPVSRTLQELRRCFYLWSIDEYEVIADLRPGVGYEVRYLREGQWQSVQCRVSGKAENLRQCFLLLERLRIAERSGVQYSSLTSSTALAAAGPQTGVAQNYQDLEDAYAILGCAPDDPMDLIEHIYNRKAQYYHPDKGGDKAKMSRLNQALDIIKKQREGK